jgi:hypothetical protein
VWPGLLGLACLLRGQGFRAGLGLGAQGLCYLYSGLVFGLVALILRPRGLNAKWGLLAAALIMVPYALYLSPWLDQLHPRPAPSGPTALPIAGLLGLDGPPERLQATGILLIGLLGGRRVGLAAGLALILALGPLPTWSGGAPLFTSPLAWLQDMVPGLDRMHHPVRHTLLALPLLALGLATLMARGPRWLPIPAVGLAMWLGKGMPIAAAWEHAVDPPGAGAARWIHEVGPPGAVIDLTGGDGSALGLQPIHRRPMREGLRRRPLHPAPWTAAATLCTQGFSLLLAIDRHGDLETKPIEEALGPPIRPQVFSLCSPPLDPPAGDAAIEPPAG